ncbi:helix-turn-helix domain-containing protein [Phenylobacterium terrae]|uniref:Helix-turn-helix domain-containing protein n=1 Tax=Phenylobacterium terrae TaxID=2665495 RepID=A0ABW4N534_9CAUL
MKGLRFNNLEFDEAFLTARAPDGTSIRFTRQERALLVRMAAHPGRLFSRDELLTALGSRGSDRNVDFTINRLRAKLGDTAARRRFISTQYGEGYLWVAATGDAPRCDAILAIAPLADGPEPVARLLDRLQRAIEDRLGRTGRVYVSSDGGREGAHRFELEVTAHRIGERTHVALVLRDARTAEVLSPLRTSFETDNSPAPDAAALADTLTEAMWRHLVLRPHAPVRPTSPPLHIRLHEASEVLDPPGHIWERNAAMIAELEARTPHDPSLPVLRAMQLLGTMIVRPSARPLNRRTVEAVECEIESLVLSAYERVGQDPVLALACAKLLLNTNRGHQELAEQLATAAFASSAAFAASFPMLAEISASRGDLAEAVRLYDEGLLLCERGSTFETYILVLKAAALIAADDRAGVEAVYRRLQEIAPPDLPRYALAFLPADDGDGLARNLAPLVDRATPGEARHLLALLCFRFARRFVRPEHAANLMRGPLTWMIRRFGPGIVSDELWCDIPEELGYLRAGRRSVAPS